MLHYLAIEKWLETKTKIVDTIWVLAFNHLTMVRYCNINGGMCI